jgi:hypothetical protein
MKKSIFYDINSYFEFIRMKKSSFYGLNSYIKL